MVMVKNGFNGSMYRQSNMKNKIPLVIFAVLFSLIATGIGGILGYGAEFLYHARNPESMLPGGGTVGDIAGLVTGISFVFLVRVVIPGCGGREGSLIGIFAGILCSTLIHVYLIFIHSEIKYMPPIIGGIIGLFTGALLGAIGGFVLKFRLFRK